MHIFLLLFRLVLVLIFLYSGIEKLFLPFNPSDFKADVEMTDALFFEFYYLLQKTGYLYFVGFFQLLCRLLLLIKRTQILGSIMLMPLLLCLLMTHVFISKYMWYILFDSALLGINSILLIHNYSSWKTILQRKQ